ncbi:MAG: glycosyltransferase family A protein [Acidimicrobiales bacterium]
MNAPIDHAVSVVIPTYSGARHIAATIDSIAAQPHVTLQIIVVDDASPDGSADIVREMKAGGTPVELVSHTENRGVAAARNTGLAAARHDLIAFCDHDDLWAPDKLALQIAALEQTGCDLVLGHVEHFVEPGIEVPAWFQQRWGESAHPAWFLSAALVRRRVFERVGTFDATKRNGGDDVDWFARVKMADVEIVVLDEVVLHRRVHDQNLSAMTRQHNAELLEVIRAAAAARSARGLGERIDP